MGQDELHCNQSATMSFICFSVFAAFRIRYKDFDEKCFEGSTITRNGINRLNLTQAVNEMPEIMSGYPELPEAPKPSTRRLMMGLSRLQFIIIEPSPGTG